MALRLPNGAPHGRRREMAYASFAAMPMPLSQR